MTYAFTQDVPIDKATYRRITDQLGDAPPPGMLLHLAFETETGLRYLDIWESKEARETFEEERLHPVVHGLLREIGFDPLPPEPPMDPLALVHVWAPQGDVSVFSD